MSFLVFSRNKSFWILDALRGGPVRKAYDAINKIDCTDSESLSIQKYQKKRWEELKKKAVSTTEFYAPFANTDLKGFPVINKNIIRAQQSKFMSSSYQKDKLFTMSTSGSTGTPFVCYQNSGKKKHVNAECIYYGEKAGWRLGENLCKIRATVRQMKKSKFKQFIQNQTVIDCQYFGDENIERVIREIQQYSSKGVMTLFGYSSTFSAIKDYILKHDIDKIPNVRVTGLVGGADMLFDETRAVISRAFGDIPMRSRYSNEENGVLGQDEGINNVFIINEADYIIEILDEEGNEVKDGIQGRVVITDLFNYAMPMIRYDTGDFAAIEIKEINGRKKRCLTSFSGRKVDVIFNTDGEALSPHTITNNMWLFPDVTQFQIVQIGEKQYRLKLNVPQDFARIDEVVELMKQFLGKNAEITVEKVEEIPVLASGKRRYIVNEWKR